MRLLRSRVWRDRRVKSGGWARFCEKKANWRRTHKFESVASMKTMHYGYMDKAPDFGL